MRVRTYGGVGGREGNNPAYPILFDSFGKEGRMIGMLTACVVLLTAILAGICVVGYWVWRVWKRESLGEFRFDRAPWREREYWG